MKNRKKWTQWENDEKRRKSNEKWWKTGNKWKQFKRWKYDFFFSALLVGDCCCTLRWHMTSENDENYRVSFIYSFPFNFLSFLKEKKWSTEKQRMKTMRRRWKMIKNWKKKWKQWENDEKPRKHIKSMMKHRKKWTQWENDEKRRKNNEKWWKTGNKWKQLENDETVFFSTTCGRLPLHTKMAHDLGERWKLPGFLYL